MALNEFPAGGPQQRIRTTPPNPSFQPSKRAIVLADELRDRGFDREAEELMLGSMFVNAVADEEYGCPTDHDTECLFRGWVVVGADRSWWFDLRQVNLRSVPVEYGREADSGYREGLGL